MNATKGAPPNPSKGHVQLLSQMFGCSNSDIETLLREVQKCAAGPRKLASGWKLRDPFMLKTRVYKEPTLNDLRQALEKATQGEEIQMWI